ncbi:MAG TPA: asparagine synthase B [Thermoleophilaceae bacterium]|nr:asparagine synthase B [Thermoleophilaceae bacterium]
MCGIVGAHGALSPEEFEAMLTRVAHRGPDDQGTVRVNGSWLGHTRLSIVDVESGRQPLGGDGLGMWLVGNGEVYNHEDVRASLDNAPYLTKSDNEVALHLLRERGPHALDELEGMFAFLGATEEGDFIAARDAVGIKPLYWAREDGRVVFASEIAAFTPELQGKVESFPPGHLWTPENGVERFAEAVPLDGRDAVEGQQQPPSNSDRIETRETLINSVRRQLMGDVPVGVFLSGGLDSSLIAAIAAKLQAEEGETLQTFAVGTEGSSDIMAARRVAEHIGSEHRERLYDAAEAVEVVPEVVRAIEHFDPSLVRSAVPNYLLAEMTVQHVKVVLTGEGADELFAGYDYLHNHIEEGGLHDEIVRTVEELHGLNLQRADRVTMAHGLEARVPFLDREVIAYAVGLPAAWKVAGPDDPEKRLLREAFDGWLPEDLLWRGKEQFGDGSGASKVLTEVLELRISEEEFEAEKDQLDPPVRTREELAYLRIFREYLPRVRIDRTLTRFATA